MKLGPFPTQEGCQQDGAAPGVVVLENPLTWHLNVCAFAYRENSVLNKISRKLSSQIRKMKTGSICGLVESSQG